MGYHTVSQRFFRPRRPHLLEALGCVLGRAPDQARIGEELESLGHKKASFSAGRIAWESLAARDLIPMSWLDDPARRFHHGRHNDFRCHPSPKMAVLLAANLQSILTAEGLAREAVARGQCWGRPVPSRVLWRMSKELPSQPHDQLGEMPMGEIVSDARSEDYPVTQIQRDSLPALQLDSRVGDVLEPLQRDGHGGYVPRALWQAIYNHRWWELSAKEGRTVTDKTLKGFPQGMKSNPGVEGRLFSELRNPFTPALHIWGLGYALVGVTEEFLVLFMLGWLHPWSCWAVVP